MRRRLTIVVILLLLGAVVNIAVAWGCAAAPTARATPQQLHARAAFDLACHPGWLQVYALGDGVRGVIGCGQRITYVEQCELVEERRRCLWVRDTAGPARPTATTPTPASSPLPAATNTSSGNLLDDHK